MAQRVWRQAKPNFHLFETSLPSLVPRLLHDVNNGRDSMAPG